MFEKTMTQDSSGEGISVQSGRDTILTVGLSYSDARDIALDVFRQNAYKLSEVAMKTVSERVEKITNDFFSELLAKNSNGVAQAQDPDFQYVFLQAQTSYARSGAADLEQLLVDLLVDRIGAAERDILQIVLNESLATVSKLTDSHIATLAVAFFFQHVDCRPHGLEQFGTSLDDVIRPMANKLSDKRSCIQHLHFTGCGTPSAFSNHLESVLRLSLAGLFMQGFTPELLRARGVVSEPTGPIFIPCLHDRSLLQVNGMNESSLDANFDRFNVLNRDRDIIKNLFRENVMPDQKIRETCEHLRGYMGDVFRVYNTSALASFTLTSVGMAIGHAAIRRNIAFPELGMWLS